MDFLVDVLDLFKKFGFLISLDYGWILLVWMQEEELCQFGANG